MTQLPTTAGDQHYCPNKALCKPSQTPNFLVKRIFYYSAGGQMPIKTALPHTHGDKHEPWCLFVHSTFPKSPALRLTGLSKHTFLCQTIVASVSDSSLSFFTHCLRQECFRELERPQRLFKLKGSLVEGE